MKNCILFSIILKIILKTTLGGTITPYGSSFITISNSNPQSIADYNFTFTLSHDIPPQG